MKKLFIKISSIILVCLFSLSAGIASISAAGFDMSLKSDYFDSKKLSYIEGEVIAAIKNGASSDCLKKQKASEIYGKGVKLKNTFSFKNKSGNSTFVALKSSSLSTNELISSLKKNSSVKYAFPNCKRKVKSITNDALSDFQWPLENNGQNGGTKGEDIKIKSLWEKADKSKSEKRVVAVLDTGIDYKNSELKDVLWENPYGNKLLGKYGYDFSLTNADGNPMDDNGHGTHISGIIAAASGNGSGISGMNKKNIEIMAVKAFDYSGEGSDESILAGFEYIQRAIELGTKVCAVNCSFGDYGTKENKKAYDDVINALGEKGVITCVAAGNEYVNLNDQNDPESDDYEYGIMVIPACCDSPYCITVAASDENGDLDDYSNYGDKYVDIAAPGDNILSVIPENCFNPTIYTDKQREKLCAYYQNFDGEIKSGDFGYPEILTDTIADMKLSKSVKVEPSEKFFGLSGKSIKFSIEGKRANKSAYFAFEIPFSIEDEEKDYDISLVINSKSYCIGYVFDVPADYNYSEDIDDDTYSEVFGAFGGNDWPHYAFNIDVKNKSYEKAKDRKLIFLISAKDDVIIDDLAISKQLDDRDELGKYEFESGASMATAFVTGAAALVNTAYPDASVKEIINIVKNTGKVNSKLEGKIKNAKTLTLDTTEKFPPFLEKAVYTNDGDVKIEGMFNGTNKVYVNDTEVTVKKQDSESIIIGDKGYNTHFIKIKVENSNGSDTLETVIYNKKELEKTDKIKGSPEDTSSMLTVTDGRNAYFIDRFTASVGVLNTVEPKSRYNYTDEMYSMDLKKLLKNESFEITSAVYYDNKIYLTVRSNIMTSSKTFALGYDTFFISYDLSLGKLKKLCDVPEECSEGAGLGVLKGKFYLLGGFIKKDLKFIDSVYIYNAKKSAFEKTSYNLPNARAYTSFIEYGGKLIGFWGAEENGEMPSAIVFDGKEWTSSIRKLTSSDYVSVKYSDEFTLKNYSGNLGVDKNGVFCNGSFVEDYGDIFVYDVVHDKIIPNEYCYRNDLSLPRLIGTTVSGGFVGFNLSDYYDEDYDEDDYEEESGTKAYFVELDNTSLYPEIKKPYLSAKSASLKAGGEITLTVKNSSAVSWNSTDKKIAVVKDGKVSALKKGTAYVTVTLVNGDKLSCKISVTSDPAIKVNGKKLNASKFYPIKEGKKLKLSLSGKSSAVKNAYATSNKDVAKVVSSKTAKTVYIKGYKKGKAAIAVKFNGVKFKLKIKVI